MLGSFTYCGTPGWDWKNEATLGVLPAFRVRKEEDDDPIHEFPARHPVYEKSLHVLEYQYGVKSFEARGSV